MTVKKIYRLKRDRDFKQVIAANQTVKNKFFIVYYLRNQAAGARVGISVSKKLGGAVQRNRIRRQIRAMFDQSDIFATPVDMLVIVRTEYKPDHFQEAQGKLLEIMAAIRRIANE